MGERASIERRYAPLLAHLLSAPPPPPSGYVPETFSGSKRRAWSLLVEGSGRGIGFALGLRRLVLSGGERISSWRLIECRFAPLLAHLLSAPPPSGYVPGGSLHSHSPSLLMTLSRTLTLSLPPHDCLNCAGLGFVAKDGCIPPSPSAPPPPLSLYVPGGFGPRAQTVLCGVAK